LRVRGPAAAGSVPYRGTGDRVRGSGFGGVAVDVEGDAGISGGVGAWEGYEEGGGRGGGAGAGYGELGAFGVDYKLSLVSSLHSHCLPDRLAEHRKDHSHCGLSL
jgi:hypothetical protein